MVVVEKGIYPLGISIGEGTKGGVFVTLVNDNSVAAAAGLQYGDQLLEVNVVIHLLSFEFSYERPTQKLIVPSLVSVVELVFETNFQEFYNSNFG